jgi:hypothetical protein
MQMPTMGSKLRMKVRCVAAIAMLLPLVHGCKKEPPPPKPESRPYAQTPYANPEASADSTDIRFTDVTQGAGLHFPHHNGAFGQKWMPETMGSGGGFIDYDNDGNCDVFLVNGADWPGHERPGPRPTQKLFRNLGNGAFADVTEAAGLAAAFYGMGCAFGDFDGDGDADIYVTAVGDNRLFRNDAGRFVDVAAEAGVLGRDPTPGASPGWSTSAAWFDADRDGDLDLFVARYVQWTPETDLFTTLDGKHKSYATPQQYAGQSCLFYRNLGGSRFEDATRLAGLRNDEGKSLGVVVDDFNDDGRPDLFVANDTQPHFLYVHQGDGTFVDRGTEAGCAYDDAGRARAGMGVDAADFNNDGVPHIVIGNFSGEPLSLYGRVGAADPAAPLLFQDFAGSARLTAPTLPCLTFGVLFADFDSDGRLDLAVANGHIEPEINAVQSEVTFAQRPQLFRNTGRRSFIDVGAAAGPPFQEPVVARGLAAADFDNDGDVDLLLTVNAGPAKLLRNDTPASDHRRWIKIKLLGAGANRNALGATVFAAAGDWSQRRFIRAGSSYLSQSDTVLVIGLGDRPQLDRLTVRWPDGNSDRFGPLAAGKLHEIRQAERANSR